MVWLYHSPIPAERRGISYSFKIFIPAVTGLEEEGGGGHHPVGQTFSSHQGIGVVSLQARKIESQISDLFLCTLLLILLKRIVVCKVNYWGCWVESWTPARRPLMKRRGWRPTPSDTASRRWADTTTTTTSQIWIDFFIFYIQDSIMTARTVG